MAKKQADVLSTRIVMAPSIAPGSSELAREYQAQRKAVLDQSWAVKFSALFAFYDIDMAAPDAWQPN